MSQPHLLVVIGCYESAVLSIPLVEQFFRHYLECGITPQNVHVTLLGDASIAEVKSCIKQYGIDDIREVACFSHDPAKVTMERQTLQKSLPIDSWFINPDIDELISFPKPVPDLVKDMEQSGFDCLSGWLWDRFDRYFLLKEVHPTHPIHLQFPVTDEYSSKVLAANTRKDVLARNWFTVQEGAQWLQANGHTFHPAPTSWQLRVDHYRWTAGLKQRTEWLLASSLKQPEKFPRRQEYERILNAIQSGPQGDFMVNEAPLHVVTRFPRKTSFKLRFVHIPKTAGTTIIKVINHWYPGMHRILNWKNHPLEQRMVLRDEPFVVGHLPLRHLAIDTDASTIWFTVLRDPEEQAISCYYEIAKNMSHRPPEKQDLIEMGLESLLLTGRFAPLWNGSLRFLSSLPAEATPEQALESAKRNIKKFTLVGFYEDLPAFVQKMARILGQEWQEPLPHENTNSFKPDKVCLSAEARAALRQITQLDREIYDLAREVFDGK